MMDGRRASAGQTAARESVSLADCIDSREVQTLMDDFYALTSLPIGLIDLNGEVLVGTGWQDVCTKFHRVHPATRARCLESDLVLTQGVPKGECRSYKCENGMRDIVTPLYLGDDHVANIFVGQFVYDDEEIDFNFFEKQAELYDFDRASYLAAVQAIPRFSRPTVDRLMRFYATLAQMLAEVGKTNMMLAETADELGRAHTRLSETEARDRAVAANTPDHVVVQDADLRYTAVVNPQLGLTQDQMIGFRDEDILDADSAAGLTALKSQVLATGETLKVDLELPNLEGSMEYFDGTYVPYINDQGVPIGVIGYFRNVTELRQLQAEMTRLARTDDLTGIANRREFLRVAENELARSVRHGHQMAIAMADMDHLKQINDTYGHKVGDKALRNTADVLTTHVREGDLVARLGGDEFVVLMPETDLVGAQQLVGRLQELLAAAPLRVSDVELTLSFCAGVTALAEVEPTVDALMSLSDRRLCDAKHEKQQAALP
ncbi:MAG: diguanylate cyclase [Coriobacteriia bacterium]|nr:diguanylate cyclase [Coriobacteriia bacterium]